MCETQTVGEVSEAAVAGQVDDAYEAVVASAPAPVLVNLVVIQIFLY